VELERSGLAAAVPSFVDPDLALQDPLVRQRLTTPAQPTCPDVQAKERTDETAAATPDGDPDVWYVRYRDRSGHWCKARATTQQGVRRRREGRVMNEVEASPQPRGEFLPLATFAEFRDARAAQARMRKIGLAAKRLGERRTSLATNDAEEHG